jgi:anti-anti-sigma regulatory factor
MSAPVESSQGASALPDDGSLATSARETVGSASSAASGLGTADKTSVARADEPPRVLVVKERRLARAHVERLVAELRNIRGAAAIAIDLGVVEGVTPDALAALIELGRSQAGIRELALTGLSRALTLAAVQVGLAERFSIYASAEAFTRAAGTGGT